jgi:epoxyqueuosine reductase
MPISPIIEKVRRAGAPYGLNLVATAAVERYDAAVAAPYRASAIAPASRTIIVVGNGGGALWTALRRHAGAHPGWFERANPLDDFTREIVEGEIAPAARIGGATAHVVYPFMHDAATLNFIELGKAAGLAGPSILGVVVHPIYGPWIAFRAAILIDQEIDAPGDAAGFDPCPSCTVRSCIPACPVEAIAFPSGWDIPKCLTHRVEDEPDCAPRCHARAGCVLGPQHRYPDDELAYHQMRALRAMRPWYEAHAKPEADKDTQTRR